MLAAEMKVPGRLSSSSFQFYIWKKPRLSVKWIITDTEKRKCPCQQGPQSAGESDLLQNTWVVDQQRRLENRQCMWLVLPFGNLNPLFLDLHFFKRSKLSTDFWYFLSFFFFLFSLICFCFLFSLFRGVKFPNFRILGNNPAFFPSPESVQAALSGLDRTYLEPHFAQGLSVHNLSSPVHDVGILRGREEK